MSKISAFKDEGKNKGHDTTAEHRRKKQLGAAVKKEQERRAHEGNPHRENRHLVQAAKHRLVEEATAAEVADIDDDYEDSYAS